MNIKPCSTQVQPDVHHDNRPPSDTLLRPSTSKRAPGGRPPASIPAAFGVPFTYWGNGGFLPGMTVVGNHNPTFAPAIEPTLRTGTEAALAATLAYVGR